MSEMGDDFREMREARKERNRSKLEAAPGILQAAGIAYQSKNDGQHFIVPVGDKVIDFWPSTGRWALRKSGRRGGNVHALLRFVANLKAPQPGQVGG